MQSLPTPESIVRIERMGSHFTKYHLGSGKLLHHFTAAEDEHYHDHPFNFTSTILSGGYVEEVGEVCGDGTLALVTLERLPGTTHEVNAGTIHKLTGLLSGECWTLVEVGDWEREPGFYRADENGVWHRFWFDQEWTLLCATEVLI